MPEVRIEEADGVVTLTNGFLLVEVHLNKGTYDVRTGDASLPAIVDAAATVRFLNGPSFSTRGEELEFAGTTEVADVHGKGVVALLSREADEGEPEVHLLITLYEHRQFAVIRAEVQNRAARPARIQELRPMDGAVLKIAGEEPLRFYKHGWQSWSPTVVLDTAGTDVPDVPPVIGPGTQPEKREGRFVSDLVTALVDPADGRGTVAGFMSSANQFSQLWFDRDGRHLSGVSYADGIEAAPRGVLASEPLFVELTGDPVTALTAYGDAVAREMGARPPKEITSGWCSWYYYWQGVTASEMAANVERIVRDRDSLPLEYIQVDDGYQAEIGDWLTPDKSKFPDGMAAIAGLIHSAGFKAGIWLAPFLAGEKSRLYAEHPDWFVRSAMGDGHAEAIQNWGQTCYALDLTNTDVIEWLRAVFRTICDEWGFDYVKIDFIYAGAIDGTRNDPNVTRAQAYRRGLEAIRETIGDRFILACGNPQGASVGLVDGARIGPDVAPYWKPFDRRQPDFTLSDPAAINSIRNSIDRYWMHNRLWSNDPDCLLVRDSETALSGDETRTLASVVAMTGGMVLNSDNLAKVPPERQRLISLLLPAYGKAAAPLDLFRPGDVPRLLGLDCGSHRLLAVFNWEDAEAGVSAELPPGEWHAFEFWEHEYLGVARDRMELAVPGRGCRLLRLTEVLDRPQVVGSTLHIAQGALEIDGEEWDGESLSVRLMRVACADGSIFVWREGEVVELTITGLREARTVLV
jgi:alpha-galactosidase